MQATKVYVSTNRIYLDYSVEFRLLSPIRLTSTQLIPFAQRQANLQNQ